MNVPTYRYRGEVRADGWGRDGSWDADEIPETWLSLSEAGAAVAGYLKEDAEDRAKGEDIPNWEYRITRLPVEWEEVQVFRQDGLT